MTPQQLEEEKCKHGHINSYKNGVCGKCTAESHVCEYSVVIDWQDYGDDAVPGSSGKRASEVMCPKCLNNKEL